MNRKDPLISLVLVCIVLIGLIVFKSCASDRELEATAPAANCTAEQQPDGTIVDMCGKQ